MPRLRMGCTVMITFPYDSIDGLLSAEDRIGLRDLAASCKELPGVIVEIGSYKGLSACCIMDGLPNKTIICMDWFEIPKRYIFWQNIEDAGFRGRVTTAVGDFKQGTSLFEDLIERGIAFSFCDHTHSLDDTKFAHDWLWPLIQPGGILAFHDYRNNLYPEATVWLDTLPHKRVLETSILAFRKE